MLANHILSKPELRQAKPGRAAFASKVRNPITVILDGVSGLYNIGAMFRPCDAFLVERLIICGEPTEAMLRKRKLVKAAMGTQRWVRWQEAPDAAPAVCAAKAAGHWIAVVEMTAASVTPAAMRPRYPAVLVLGNERSGVSPGVLAVADQAVAIPMLGMANSLNVTTAGAIVLHEMMRRRAHDERLKRLGIKIVEPTGKGVIMPTGQRPAPAEVPPLTEAEQKIIEQVAARKGRPLEPHETHLALQQVIELGEIDRERLPYSVLAPAWPRKKPRNV